MKLVFIHGAPAVGKLTVAREVARLTRYRLFHNHLTVDLVGSVFEFGSEPFILLREQIWLSTFRTAAEHHVSLIFTFNPETTVRERFIQDTVDITDSLGGKVFFVELTCSQNELERRMEDPSRNEFDKLRSVAQYRALSAAGAFQFPKLPNDLVLDTTDASPATTAELISKRLALGE